MEDENLGIGLIDENNELIEEMISEDNQEVIEIINNETETTTVQRKVKILARDVLENNEKEIIIDTNETTQQLLQHAWCSEILEDPIQD